MKACEKHWQMLRTAIEARCLDHLVSKSADECKQQLEAEIDTGEPFLDPLMRCFMMMIQEAMSQGGTELLIADHEKEGNLCPVCTAMINTSDATPEDTEKNWIDGPAQACLEHYRKLGLAPTVQ